MCGLVPVHNLGVGDRCFRVLVRASWLLSLQSFQENVHLSFFIPVYAFYILHVFTCLIYTESCCEGGREGGFGGDALKQINLLSAICRSLQTKSF